MTQPPRVRDMDWPSGIPDDEWEELAQGIPAKNEPFINKYLAGREALIGEEKKQRSDHIFRQSLSPLAKEACAIVKSIRDHEQATIWTSEFENHFAQETGANIFPGMMFQLAKTRMETTKLWKILRKMPKGALLHAHMDAMVDFDFLFDVLLKEKGIHIQAKTGLSGKEELEGGGIKFRFFGEEKGTDQSIWSKDYKPDTPVLLSKAADSFPNGGRAGFLTWLKSRCTITSTESLSHHDGVDAVWRKFSSVFTILNTIIFYEPIFRLFLRRMMSQLLLDNVQWVDLRLAFTFHYYAPNSETPESNYSRMFSVFDEEIKNFKASKEGERFWGCRMIWTGVRILNTRKIVEDMDACISIKLKYPHLIAGYDLVGQEDPGRPLKDLLPELFWFKKSCAEEGVNIPFFFHAGETLGDGTDTDENLFDAILLGTRRIGHGFSLYKHPLLINMVKEKKILVESCPISNEILRLCGSITSHPLPALLARGVDCALCNDDPAILGQDTAGMTHDFWQAVNGWGNLGLEGLGSLAENSVRWASFEDETGMEWGQGLRDGSVGTGVRGERLREWWKGWERFCLWVVTEFGDGGEGDGEGGVSGILKGEGGLDEMD